MKIDRVVVGGLQENCYIISIDDKCLVIDPGDEANKIIGKIGDDIPVGIIVTHRHFDHVGAVTDLVNKYHIKIYDKHNLPEGINTIDKFTFEVIYTPGHKDDSVTIYFKEDKCMFSGDFIFKNDIGRCDLAGGSDADMLKSIDKIKKYDKDIPIYPGHGIHTTLGYEINNNPYFKDYI